MLRKALYVLCFCYLLSEEYGRALSAAVDSLGLARSLRDEPTTIRMTATVCELQYALDSLGQNKWKATLRDLRHLAATTLYKTEKLLACVELQVRGCEWSGDCDPNGNYATIVSDLIKSADTGAAHTMNECFSGASREIKHAHSATVDNGSLCTLFPAMARLYEALMTYASVVIYGNK
jgi:hypothetical protein